MRGLLTIVVLAMVGAGPALACTQINNVQLFFACGSVELSRQSLNSLKAAIHGWGAAGRTVPAACVDFEVIGHMDTAEAALPDGQLDIARAEVVQRALEQLGGRTTKVGNRPGERLVPTGPNVKEPQNRYVTVSWNRARGRMRCDPSTLNDQTGPQTTCGITKYAACYWELTDGTICNFNGVSDPNPQRFSATD